MLLGIYGAAYSELKDQESVEFDIYECEKVGEHIISTKNKIKSFNIPISNESEYDRELCREEIRVFLIKENIDCHNSCNKFPIS